MTLMSELRRRNVFRMLVLYMVAAWLIMQVAEVVITLANLPDWIGPVVLGLLAIGFPIALGFSWIYELTPDGMKLEKDIDPTDSMTQTTGRRIDFLVISLLCAAVILFAYDKWGMSDPPDQSVAVLPFLNLSDNADNEYLSDGLTEVLLHAIAQSSDLKVSARTSSFFFKGRDLDVREIAGQLGVSNILEGSVQQDGARIRVVAQLIDAETGFHLWSQTYDRDVSNIFAVQDDIAMSVAEALNAEIRPDVGMATGKFEVVGTKNTTAYDWYLQGLAQKKIFSFESLQLAENSFKEALILDPEFLDARLALGYTYYEQGLVGAITTIDAREKALPLLDQVFGEQPDNGSALALWAYAKGFNSIDVEKQIEKLTAAVDRDPNELMLYRAIADLSNSIGQFEQAIEWLERGIAVDPLDSMLHFSLGEKLHRVGEFYRAQAAIDRGIELNPDFPSAYALAASNARRRGDYTQWFALMRKAMDLDRLDPDIPSYMARHLYVFGLLEEGDKYLARSFAISPVAPQAMANKLYGLLQRGEYVKVRNLSEAMLREGIRGRSSLYGHRVAGLVYASTMADIDQSQQVLTLLEEIVPEITSPSFAAETQIEGQLQLITVVVQSQVMSKQDIVQRLEDIEPRWDESFPNWRRSVNQAALVAQARGQTDEAAKLALAGLERSEPAAIFYRHLSYFQTLANDGAVAARLVELEAEYSRAGDDIWKYIVEHDLQL